MIYNALHEAKMNFYKYHQSDDKSLADHMRNFKDLINSVEYHGGDIFYDKEMVQYEMRIDLKNKVSDTNTVDYRPRIMEKAKAVAFIKSSNKKQ